MVKTIWTATVLLALAAHIDNAVGGIGSIWAADRGDLLLTALVFVFLIAAYAPFALRHLATICEDAVRGLNFVTRFLRTIEKRLDH